MIRRMWRSFDVCRYGHRMWTRSGYSLCRKHQGLGS